MVKKIISIFLLIFLTSGFLSQVHAQEPNNKFGIHTFDESDLPDAAALVNSNGGQWGYVTIVIREDERDHNRWQNIFNQMRRLKLIPIIRLATKMDGQNWEIPKEEEANNWAGFLNSLNWPVKNRYVVLFNEPNHAKEWGGKLDPASYTNIARKYFHKFKSFSNDFFILPAALDLAAPNSSSTMEASRYFDKMHDEDNFIFTLFDGLNSHSYPNPGFSGNPDDIGQKSIQGYKWEISYLKNLGMNPNIPVFITETGWVRNKNNANDDERLGDYYKKAFETIWNSDQIVAVTPFLLNYLSPPFDAFSWKDSETNSYYPVYSTVQSFKKQKGEPEQYSSYEYESDTFAQEVSRYSKYSFFINLKNTGQSIWNPEDHFSVHYKSTLPAGNIIISKMPTTEPGQTAPIRIQVDTNAPLGKHTIEFKLNKDGDPIGDTFQVSFIILNPPRLTILARSWFGKPNSSNDYTLKMYKDQSLVLTLKDILVKDDIAHIDALYDVFPNQTYKFVLSKPFNLPSTRNVFVSSGTTIIDFGRFIPLDLNGDSKLDFSDFVAYIINPTTLNILTPVPDLW